MYFVVLLTYILEKAYFIGQDFHVTCYLNADKVLLEEALLVFLALIVAVDDLQEKAGQCDQLAVWSRKEAL